MCWMNDWIILFLFLHSNQETAALIYPPDPLKGMGGLGEHDRRRNTGLVRDRQGCVILSTFCKTGIKTFSSHKTSVKKVPGMSSAQRRTQKIPVLSPSFWLFPHLNPEEITTQGTSNRSGGTAERDEVIGQNKSSIECATRRNLLLKPVTLAPFTFLEVLSARVTFNLEVFILFNHTNSTKLPADNFIKAPYSVKAVASSKSKQSISTIKFCLFPPTTVKHKNVPK